MTQFNPTYNQQNQLEACRWISHQDLKRLPPEDRTHITTALGDLSGKKYALMRADHIRAEISKLEVLPSRLRPLARVGIAVMGAIICSAAVQSTTLTLPGWLRGAAIPLVAGFLTFLTEEAARRAVTRIRFKLSYIKAMAQLQKEVDEMTYPLERHWHNGQIDMLERVEGCPWPVLEIFVVLLVFILESGSALFWVMPEGLFLAIFAAAAPPIFVLLAATLLSSYLDDERQLKSLVGLYEEQLATKVLSHAGMPMSQTQAAQQPFLPPSPAGVKPERWSEPESEAK